MKYILITIVLFFVTGCDTKIQECPEGQLPFDMIKHFEYKKHDYIYFWEGRKAGIVHDPECNCFKIKDETSN